MWLNNSFKHGKHQIPGICFFRQKSSGPLNHPDYFGICACLCRRLNKSGAFKIWPQMYSRAPRLSPSPCAQSICTPLPLLCSSKWEIVFKNILSFLENWKIMVCFPFFKKIAVIKNNRSKCYVLSLFAKQTNSFSNVTQSDLMVKSAI